LDNDEDTALAVTSWIHKRMIAGQHGPGKTRRDNPAERRRLFTSPDPGTTKTSRGIRQTKVEKRVHSVNREPQDWQKHTAGEPSILLCRTKTIHHERHLH
jgi:hypothetical protein